MSKYDVIVKKDLDVANANVTNLSNQVGTLSNLNTSDKTNLVNAINENKSQLADKATKKKTDPWVDVKADFGAKGDGITDDTTAIKNAISSLKDGDTLLIPSSTGNYLISDALNIANKNNLNIVVNGHIKQTKHGYCVFELQTCKNVIVSGSGQIEGYNLFPSRTFDGSNREVCEKSRNGGGFATNRKNGTTGTIAFGGGWEGNTGSGVMIYDTSTNITVKDLEIFGFNYSGVSVGWMGSVIPYNRDILVTNCFIHDCQNSGIDLCKTIGVTIDSNMIHDIGHPNTTSNDTEITMGYGVTNLYTNSCAENVMIRNNRFYKCYRKGVDFHAANGNSSVIGNEIKESYVHGIATPQNTTPASISWSELDVSHNRVINCGNSPNYLTSLENTSGILFESTYGGILSDNIVKDCGTRGIEIACKNYSQTDRVVFIVSNNYVVNTNGGMSIGLVADINYTNCVLNISGNTVKSTHVTGKGIYIASSNATNTMVANVQGNTCIVPTSGSTFGLQLFQIQDGQVSNNTLVGATSFYTNTAGNVKRDNTNTFIGTTTSPAPYVLSSKVGTLTYNGDGSSTTKTIAHGLTATPTFFQVTPSTVDAGTAGIKFVTADATNLTVTFNTAPITGTNNVKLTWKAEVQQ